MSGEDRALGHRATVVGASIPRALAALAVPAALSASLESLFGMVDTACVGRWLGAAPLAALGTSAFVLWSLDATALIVAVGLSAVVARRVGEKRGEQVRAVVRQGLMLAVAAGVLLAVVGELTARLPFVVMDVAPDVAALGTDYLRMLFLGSVALFVLRAAESVFRGAGHARIPLFLLLGCCLLKLILAPLLIGGLFGAPHLGVAGAALSTVIAQAVTAVVALLLLARHHLLVLGGSWRPRFDSWREVLRIGLPNGTHWLLMAMVYMVIARITAGFGTDALAALAVGHKGEAPCYFLSTGIAVATASLVGQALGAGLPNRAARAAWTSVGVGSVLALAWGLFMMFAPERLSAIFSTDDEVIRGASSYLFIMGLSQVGMMVEIVLDGAFAGAANTMPPLLVGVPLALARIPLAWLLAHSCGLGVAGIWWALSITAMAKGVLLAVWFYAGRWKRFQVREV